jgi:FkbM family methyltransferase
VTVVKKAIFTTQVRASVVQSIKYVFPTLWIDVGLKWRKSHFEPELFLVPLLCNKDQIAIDVGANQGVYTYYMAKFAKKVIAFEPNVDLIPVLKKVTNGNVQIQSAALSNVHGDSVMRIDSKNHGLSTIEPRNNFDVENSAINAMQRYVSTRTLDSFEFADISLIKIDVEGHEEAVIQGARKTILRSKPVLIVESENRHNSGAPRRLSSMLTDLGYCGFFVRDHGLYNFDELKDSENDPRNDHAKLRYVNNFIFVPTVDQNKIYQLRIAASCLQ